MPLIPALRRQRQADLCEFKAGLFYRASSKTAIELLSREILSRKKQNRTKAVNSSVLVTENQ